MKLAIFAVMILAAGSLMGCSSDSDALAKAKAQADEARAELAKVKAEADAAKAELAQVKAQPADQNGKLKDPCKTHGPDLIVTRSVNAQRISSILDEELGKEIKKIPGVRHVEGALLDLQSFDDVPIVYLYGLDPESVLLGEIKLKQGRKLTHDDKRKVAIGSGLARNLDKKLGDTVVYAGFDFEIIAIYESYDLLENSGAVIPLREMQDILMLSKRVTTFRILLEESHKHADKVEELRIQIEALRTPAGKSYNIAVQATRDFSKRTR
jgi:hypothetical protein